MDTSSKSFMLLVRKIQPPTILPRLRDAHRLDLELFSYASELFEDQFLEA